MNRAWLLAGLAAACFPVLAQQTAVSTEAGVYGAEQSLRGAGIYARECASCHGVELRGGEAGPALVGEAFLTKWANLPLTVLHTLTRTTMPLTSPGRLPEEEYADLLAFILRQNHAPIGQRDLGASSTAIAAVRFDRPQGDGNVLGFDQLATATAPLRIDADWRHYHQDAGGTHYSPVDLINRDNVSRLEVAWRWKSDNYGPTPEYNLEVTPLMVNGVLYTTAGRQRDVVALDAQSGQTLWMYRLDEGLRGLKAPRINSGRGVAYWEDGDDARIVYVTPGYQMIALDAHTGRPVDGFGEHGIVDLKQGLDQDVDSISAPIGLTSPPLVVADTVVVGAVFGAGGAPPTKEGVVGHMRGYDVRTGKRKWIFHTVPKKGEYGYDTWGDGSADYTGNTGSWAPFSADLERGYVYIAVEAATGDMFGGHRPGDNLFSQSLVCLDARTGKRIWHYQMIHHDIWDYDPPTAPILADLKVDGEVIPAVIQVTKQAFTFTFNRLTGEPVWPIEERPVPQSTLGSEKTAPTQPFPTRPAPFDKQGVSEDDLLDFTPEINAEARRIAAQMQLGPLFTPHVEKGRNGKLGTLMMPGYGGGANWQGAAFDPETNVLYVPSLTRPQLVGMGREPAISNMEYVMTQRDIPGPFGLPLVKPPWGRITAIDMNRGEHLWMIANADTPKKVREHEKLKGVTLPRTGHWDRGGLLITKSLLFAGEGSGLYAANDGGPMFRAHDKATGEILFEYELPANQSGVPMTYAINGRQYIIVAVGAENHPGELVALTVPAGK